MKSNFFRSSIILISAFLVCLYGTISFAEHTSQTDVNNAIRSYENGDYESAEKYIVAALNKDKRDVGATIWNALITMEKAKNNRESDRDSCKAVAEREYHILGKFWYDTTPFVDNDKLYSYYYAAYAKSYWLYNRPGRAGWYIKQALALYPKNYEALHVKGQIALDEAGDDTFVLTQRRNAVILPNDSFNESLDTAYKSFVAELEAAGSDAPEIRSRAAHWAAAALYRREGATGKVKELLETSIKLSPAGIHGVSSNKMLLKRFPVK